MTWKLSLSVLAFASSFASATPVDKGTLAAMAKAYEFLPTATSLAQVGLVNDAKLECVSVVSNEKASDPKQAARPPEESFTSYKTVKINGASVEWNSAVSFSEINGTVQVNVQPFAQPDVVKVTKLGFMTKLKNMDGTGVYHILSCGPSTKN